MQVVQTVVLLRAAVLLVLSIITVSAYAESVCYGTTARGKLEGAVELPARGANFTSYSEAAIALGRTHVHSRVEKIVVAAYRALEKSSPGTQFVYGETGWRDGGSFKPHRTHQNGLSVDFFVPVRDAGNRSVPLPTNVTNQFGYAIEFDRTGRFGEYVIDFAALGEHLYQLHRTARDHGAAIKLVILDPPYLPKLFATPRGPFLKANVPFMKKPAWVRHDEHYHVDFEIPCKPLPK